MNMKKLGNSDLEITALGLGTWAIGGGGWEFSWGSQDDRDSVAVIVRALELGINWIDTAPVYGLGHSEEIVGSAIKEYGEKPIVATKCGLTWDAGRNILRNLKKDSVRAEVEASLKRLQLDVIDLYQIHWPDPDENIEEAWEAVAALVQEGKIRYAGVCNFNVEQLRRAQKIHPVTSLQPPYSMLERDIEKKILPFCEANNIGVVAYSPMQKGILTDKFTRHFVKSLPEDDHRIALDPNFREPRLGANLGLGGALRGLAATRNVKVAQLAVAWILRRPEVTAAIVGARRTSQIEETIRAVDCIISESKQDLDLIEMLLDRNQQNGKANNK